MFLPPGFRFAPEDLLGDPELPRPLLACGEAERLLLPGELTPSGPGEKRPRRRGGLMEGLPGRSCLRGGELDERLASLLLGEREDEEELPEEDAEGERRLRAGDLLRLCLGPGGGRLGGLLRRGDMRLRGLDLRRGE